MPLLLFIFLIFTPTEIFGCIHSENIDCLCDFQSIECIGSGEDPDEINQLFFNISLLHPMGDLNTLTLNISMLKFPSFNNFTHFSIKHLNIIGSQQDLDRDIFYERWNDIETLKIQGTNIVIIDNLLFNSLYNLSELYLDNNQISEIDSYAFSNLNSLKVLSLSANHLSNISRSALQPLFSLQTLIMNDNNITSISSESFVSETLKSLHIQKNQIEGFLEKDSLSGVPNLTHLNLSSNQLKGINSSALSALIQLQVLNASMNDIQYLSSGSFSQLLELEVLDLSRNKIQIVPSTTFSKLYKLRRLDLHHNRLLAMLCFYTIDLFALEFVDLRFNSIRSFQDKTFSSSPNLQYLFLKDNPLNDQFCPLNTTTTSVDIVFPSKNCIILDNCANTEEEDDEEDYDEETDTVSTTNISVVTENETIDYLNDSVTTEATFSSNSHHTDNLSTTSFMIRDDLSTTETNIFTSETESSLFYPATNHTFSSSSESDFTLNPLNSSISSSLHPISETSVSTTEMSPTSVLTDTTLKESSLSAIFSTSPFFDYANDSESDIDSTKSNTVYETTSSKDSFSNHILEGVTSVMESSTEPINATDLISERVTTYNADELSTRISVAPHETFFKISEIHIQNYTFDKNELCIVFNLTSNLKGKQRCSLRYQFDGSWRSDSMVCPKNGSVTKHCKKVDILFNFCLTLYVGNKRTHQDCSKNASSSSTEIPISSVLNTSLSSIEKNTFISTTDLSDDDFPSAITDVSSTSILYEVTNTEMIPFQVLKFNVFFNDSNSGMASWNVNRHESFSLCNLTISLNSTLHYSEFIFPCLSSSFHIKDIEIENVKEICLVSLHKKYGKDTKCKRRWLAPINARTSAPIDAKESKPKDHGYKNSSLVALSILLIVVLAIIITLIIRNLLKKRNDRDRYNVYYEEQTVSKRMSSLHTEPNVRYSFTPKE